jgi:hypothetical protein
MYGSKFAVAVKAGSKVLREDGSKVYLPFGSTYTLYLKNLNTVKASVKVWIDGKDVLDGLSLVLDPNKSLELSRFVRNGNLKVGNSFKFIERTSGVQAKRANKVDDGLIRVEYTFEKLTVVSSPWPDKWGPGYQSRSDWPKNDPWTKPLICRFNGGNNQEVYRGLVAQAQGNVGIGSANSAIGSATNTILTTTNGITSNAAIAASAGCTPTSVQNEVGITGAPVEQKFNMVPNFKLEDKSEALIIQLVGKKQDDAYVTVTVPTRTKASCSICYTSHKSSAKFCSQCGASLEII